VFVALAVGMLGSAMLAMIPGLSIMWTINIIIDVMFVGFISFALIADGLRLC